MSDTIQRAREIIESYDGPKIRIMEVCGTHTHEIFRLGIRNILPENIELISGPGCPVCVTPVGFIDEAIYMALEKNAIICTFGDLIRVPGTKMSLAAARAEGATVKMVYSPLDSLKIAKENPDREVVFLAVGFETTTPIACLAVKKAKEEGLTNFSILTANKTMPNAYQALKDSADAFLYPGHVHAITGEKDPRELYEKYGVDLVINGHNHLYDRTAPINGTIYVTLPTMSSHAPKYDVKHDSPYYAKTVPGFLGYGMFNVSSNKIKGTIKDLNGKIIDTFEILK